MGWYPRRQPRRRRWVVAERLRFVNTVWCPRFRAPGSPEGLFFPEVFRGAWHFPASRLTSRTASLTRATLSVSSNKAVMVLMDRVLIFSSMRGFLTLV